MLDDEYGAVQHLVVMEVGLGGSLVYRDILLLGWATSIRRMICALEFGDSLEWRVHTDDIRYIPIYN